MTKLTVVGLSLALGAGLAMAKAPAGKEVTGTVEAKSGSKLTGTFTAVPEGKKVKLTVKVQNAPEGEHAVHIHEKGDCSDPEGKAAGGHWNPTSQPHGQWGHDGFHLGDVGNMKVGKDGTGEITLTTDKWTIGGDPSTDVIGHAIVVHEKIDDFKTQPTGNAGSRIGCGVIKQ
jgi:Cu-Zn family superoxide dismutase